MVPEYTLVVGVPISRIGLIFSGVGLVSLDSFQVLVLHVSFVGSWSCANLSIVMCNPGNVVILF